MAKISAHSLRPRSYKEWTEELKQFVGDRYRCSCGWSGDLKECPGTTHKPDTEYVHTENVPDLVIPIHVRQLTKAAFMAVTEAAEEKIADYVTGRGVPGKPGYVEPQVFIPTPGHSVPRVSPNICLIAASIEAAQLCEENDRYTFEDLVRFINDDSLYPQVMDLGMKIQPNMEGSLESPLAQPKSESASTDIASTEERSAAPQLSTA